MGATLTGATGPCVLTAVGGPTTETAPTPGLWRAAGTAWDPTLMSGTVASRVQVRRQQHHRVMNRDIISTYHSMPLSHFIATENVENVITQECTLQNFEQKLRVFSPLQNEGNIMSGYLVKTLTHFFLNIHK